MSVHRVVHYRGIRPIRSLFLLILGGLAGFAMATANKTCFDDPGHIKASYALSRQMMRQNEIRVQQQEQRELAAACAQLAKMGGKNARCP